MFAARRPGNRSVERTSKKYLAVSFYPKSIVVDLEDEALFFSSFSPPPPPDSLSAYTDFVRRIFDVLSSSTSLFSRLDMCLLANKQV